MWLSLTHFYFTLHHWISNCLRVLFLVHEVPFARFFSVSVHCCLYIFFEYNTSVSLYCNSFFFEAVMLDKFIAACFTRLLAYSPVFRVVVTMLVIIQRSFLLTVFRLHHFYTGNSFVTCHLVLICLNYSFDVFLLYLSLKCNCSFFNCDVINEENYANVV